MWQHEITTPGTLLDEQGNLREAGWAKKLILQYSRRSVKASHLRLKEWDYYLVTNGKMGVALTIADNGYMGLDSISLLSFEGEPWEVTKSPMRVMPMGGTGLPDHSDHGTSAISGKGYGLTFVHAQDPQLGHVRVLNFRMDDFKDGKELSGSITLYDEPEDSMVICTPFDKPRHFYYNQKINCLRASGTVTLGEEEFRFEAEDSFGVLDWGRGVWTYHNTWYWGSASGLVDGIPFGFNIGYGFGNTKAGTENMLFYNGKAHKLSNVLFRIPGGKGQEQFMQPWTFTSDDGRFEMQFQPVLDRASCTDFKLLKSDQHQVFGKFTGTAILDDGRQIHLKDFFGFAEKVENKW